MILDAFAYAFEERVCEFLGQGLGGRQLPCGRYDAAMAHEQSTSLREIVAELEGVYGRVPQPPQTDWFELVLLENVAYLVDDARRQRAFENLRREIGIAPEAILRADVAKIAAAIADGGMKPMMRAEKLRVCAEIALGIGISELDLAVRVDPARAKQLLRQFPSVGEPSADKILLFSGGVASVAPDSNALRVLIRLGFVGEQSDYRRTYREAGAAIREEIRNLTDARSAHVLLRRHGQEVCKRSSPRCDVCAVRAECAWYRNVSSG